MPSLSQERRSQPSIRDRIQRYLARAARDRPDVHVVPLTGDASDRRYFRVIQPGAHSLVLALHAEPFDYGSLPFVNVAELLRQMPVPVPAIEGHEADLGILVLEDLGDVTLQAHLGVAAPEVHAALYRQAVDLIVVLQRRGVELLSSRYLPYGIAFDEAKLTWELNFFLQHFLEAYRGVMLSEAARQALTDEFRIMARELAAEASVLCHRDYHSRNLMVHAGRLYMIDFQDARMGPNTYDLVSLLRDSYVDVPAAASDDLIRYFMAQAEIREEEAQFRQRFDIMALQRNLKALGTFGFQTAVRRNPVYIQYIPRTLRYVRDTLHLYPRWARLHELLATHLEELR